MPLYKGRFVKNDLNPLYLLKGRHLRLRKVFYQPMTIIADRRHRKTGSFTSVNFYVITWLLLSFMQFFPSGVFAQDQDKLSQENIEEQLDQLKRQLETTLQQEEGLTKNIDLLAQERARLNGLLIKTARRVQKGEVTLSKIEGRLGELEKQRKRIQGSLRRRHASLGKMLAAMQRMGRQPPPVMATQRDDALKMVRSAMLLASLFPQLNAQAEQLTGELTELVRVISNIKSQAARLKSENKRLDNERARIKGLLAAKKTHMLEQQDELNSVRLAAENHAKSVTNLSDLIKKLDKEISKTAGLGKYEEELAKQKKIENVKLAEKENNKDLPSESENKSDKKTKIVALVSPGRIKPALPFSQAKGQLPMPALGKRIKNFGAAEKYGRRSKGISIKTREHAQITSPSDGWVVYSGAFRSYGQLLIINAGGGYHILLAGMEKIDVSVGQFVLVGEPVATMGKTQQRSGKGGKKSAPILYVEFRKDGRPIDPSPWWATGSEKAQG